MSRPRCLRCDERPEVRDTTYEGIRLACDCPIGSRQQIVPWSALSTAPRAWVYENRTYDELRHIGDYDTRPDPEVYE